MKVFKQMAYIGYLITALSAILIGITGIINNDINILNIFLKIVYISFTITIIGIVGKILLSYKK